MKRETRPLLFFLIILVSLFAFATDTVAGTVQTSPFQVNTTADETDGQCTVGHCSLREAVIAANNSGASSEIVLSTGTYLLTIAGTGENVAATGDLDLLVDVTIRGNGADLTIIDGNGLDSVFHVHAGITAVFEDLTITGGNGGGSQGGGVHVEGTLNLTNTAVVGNTAGTGGGVRLASAAASLTANSSTFSGNQGFGSAIESQQGDITLINSTVSGNTDPAQIAVITLSNAGLLTINNSTISNNNAPLGLVAVRPAA